jgi:outer membrane protein assembly factor BamB
VSNGVVYVGTGSAEEATGEATIAALDAKTGEDLWRVETEGYVSTPAIVDGVLYVGTGIQQSEDVQEGALLALDTTDGTELWTFPLAGIASDPVVIDGHVYISATMSTGDSAEQTLYAIG